MKQFFRRFYRRKSLDALTAQGSAAIGLKRELGAMDLTSLGVGVILGTGVFVVTGQAAAMHAGPGVCFSFLLAGIAAALAALCYAELGSMIPVAGSAYTYTYATLGEAVAFAIGWDLILEWCVSGALVAVGWSGYLAAFVESALQISIPQAWRAAPWTFDAAAGKFVPTGAYMNLPAVLFTLAVTGLLMRGIKLSARFNRLAVLCKLVAILLFLYYGIKSIAWDALPAFIPDNEGSFGHFGVSGVFQGASMVYLSYIGFDAVSTAAQEARNPARDIPIGTLVPVMICTGLYFLVGLVLTALVPYQELAAPSPLALGIRATGKAWLEPIVAGGAVVGLSACMLGAVLAMPRIFMTMSHDGLLPKLFGSVHPRWGTPHWATLFAGGLMALLAGLIPVVVLGEMSSIGTMFAFLLVSLGVMILRVRRPEVRRRFIIPGGAYLVPLLSCCVTGVLMLTSTGPTLARLGLWMLVGLTVYLAYGFRRSNLRAPAPVGD